jgi:hypothetical protein
MFENADNQSSNVAIIADKEDISIDSSHRLSCFAPMGHSSLERESTALLLILLCFTGNRLSGGKRATDFSFTDQKPHQADTFSSFEETW